MADTARVGLFRYCPACGRDAVEPGDYALTGARSPDPPTDWDEYRCACCNRPWTACPCSPATEGPCRARVDDHAPPLGRFDG